MSDFLKLEDLNLSSVADSEIEKPVNLSREDREIINILLPRMQKSDLKDALGYICNLAAKQPGPNLEELGELLISYRKAKVLIANKAFDFNIELKKLLYKELEQSLMKANSVMSLLNFQADSMDTFQSKGHLEVSIKNKHLIERYRSMMDLLEKEINFGASSPFSELVEKSEPDPYVSKEFSKSMEAFAVNEPVYEPGVKPIQDKPENKPYEGFNYIKTFVNIMEEHDKSMRLYDSIIVASTYKRICIFFNIPCENDENDIAKNIFNGITEEYVNTILNILNTYVVTKEADSFLNSLIGKMHSFPKREEKVEAESPKEAISAPAIPAPYVNEVELSPSIEELEAVCFKVRLLNSDGELIDEANYRNVDFDKAISDFNYFSAPIKRIGIIVSKKTIFLFESEDNNPVLMVLTDEARKVNGFDTGSMGKLVDHYIEKIGSAING